MAQAFGSRTPPLYPEDVVMMQTLLAAYCEDRCCEKAGVEAQEAARELVYWFQIGVTKQSQLRELLYSRAWS
ncbi:hypothetical protein [Rhizobium leucaenae]|jgi:hypothetical protein|uniref:Uncharacterized protein n=1 Tax=Rhizobium leucaenae TaxID=29450 RepID=A0A7W7EM65_9HYPH|nr:hypothetical protein [Rhizobium leucaenae]MBB4570751.1 hypothetical protein [Rhizobium leucaenae]MBB6303708.1 hypothetical protein [Rhizobium leucaenae]